MKKLFWLGAILLFFTPILTIGQTAVVISHCGGLDTVAIPAISDNDLDGMDDLLEQRLLNHFLPTFIEFDNESCPGPALDGTGDSNLVVCHIYPIPQQYSLSNRSDSVLTHPVAVVPKKGLITGLWWYEPLIKVNAALLYGKDCGLNGHTADVEGFNYSLKYIGPDTVAGWMYDTVMQHWMGDKIQTVAHEGTLCEKTETYPYKSAFFPTGKDTIYGAPDKHGNFLTIGGCGYNFICNPGCGGIPSKKNVRAVNIGEPNAPLIADLGIEYPAYAGSDPWSSDKFLEAQGGSAGAIPTKMLLELTSDFIQGTRINSQADICNIYSNCFPAGSAYQAYRCSNVAFEFYGQQLTGAGTYYHTLTSSYGCDSTIALTLADLPVSQSSYSASTCTGTSYNFNGRELQASGIYVDTLTNTNGCDSTVTLQLEVKPVTNHFYTVSGCYGDAYNFNGQQLSASGDYTDTLSNVFGCDSLIHLSLFVDTLITATWNFNYDTMQIDHHPVLLTGATPAGGIYTGNGVLGNLFFPDSAGFGMHVLTYTYTDSHGCSATAIDTITILVSGIDNPGTEMLAIYPNPAHNLINVSKTTTSGSLLFQLYDMNGSSIKAGKLNDKVNIIDVSDLAKGIYTLELSEAKTTLRRKLVIQ